MCFLGLVNSVQVVQWPGMISDRVLLICGGGQREVLKQPLGEVTVQAWDMGTDKPLFLVMRLDFGNFS